jgi:hypothetical protein
MKKYIVTVEFADKDNLSNHYVPGDELPETFGEDRLANIVSRGLAKVEDTEAGTGKGNGNDTGTGNTVTDIDISSKVADLLPLIKICHDAEELKAYLKDEKAAEKPRETVIKAIEDRLANIVKE